MIRFDSTQVIIKRRAASRDPDTHRASVSVDTIETVDADVQPASGDVIEHADEGEYTGNELTVFFDRAVDVSISDDSTQEPADLIEIDGEDYKPIVVKRWNTLPSTQHVKVTCKKLD